MASQMVVLIGGPFDHQRVSVSRPPAHIVVGVTTYARIDDPDTHEFLGGYYAMESP